MAKSISVKRKKAGRPATGTEPLYGVRMSDDLIGRIQKWGRENSATRSEAIRRLVELGLGSGAKPAARRSEKNTAKAKELAAKTINSLADPAAPAEDQASRKRRLLKGPEEFRVDRAKAKAK